MAGKRGCSLLRSGTTNGGRPLEIAKAELKLPKVNDSPYVYTNEPIDDGSDIGPNNPLDEGQGVFRIRVDGLASAVPSGALSSIPVTVSTGLQSTSQELAYEGYQTGCYSTPPVALLPENNSIVYDELICLDSPSGDDILNIMIQDDTGNKVAGSGKDSCKPAFVGWRFEQYEERADDYKDIISNKLGYVVDPPDLSLIDLDVEYALPRHSMWFTFTHGSKLSIKNSDGGTEVYYGICVGKYRSSEIIALDPDYVKTKINDNPYKLVFLSACYLGEDAAADAFKEAFNAETYIGWEKAPYDYECLRWETLFFNELDGMYFDLDGTKKQKTVEYAMRIANEEAKINGTANRKGNKDLIVDLTP